MAEYYQAKKDGSIQLGEESTPTGKEIIYNVLNSAFTENDWSCTWNQTGSQPYECKVQNGEININLMIYCWRISNGGRKNRLREKRIQIGSCSDKGFNIVNAESEYTKALLLGFYENDGVEILVGWETEKNKDHGSSKSCFIDAEAVAIAMRDGFCQYKDSSGNIACAFRKEFIYYYIMNMGKLHSNNINVLNETIILNNIDEMDSDNSTKYSYNRLIYGAPGTGKSHLLEDDRKEFVGENYERVTFYEDYSYGQFVGAYKPSTDNEGKISYKFVAGPFLRQVVKAMNFEQENFVLIIEEINRAKAASVFGDMFQLLDRDSNGLGEYEVAISEEVKKYLCENLIQYKDCDNGPESIRMPKNLYIWATMNTADQGVYPLDTAFKRRFEEYKLIGINENDDKNNINEKEIDIKCNSIGIIKWNVFRKVLNEFLLSIDGIKEDKLIGPFFIKPNFLDDDKKFQQVFQDKLLMYLVEDVLKHKKNKLFKNSSVLSQIIDKYQSNEDIFIDSFVDRLIEARESEKINLYDEVNEEDNEYVAENSEAYMETSEKDLKED